VEWKAAEAKSTAEMDREKALGRRR
jgi:hypothetical protein